MEYRRKNSNKEGMGGGEGGESSDCWLTVSAQEPAPAPEGAFHSHLVTKVMYCYPPQTRSEMRR